jgi:lysophospholipase L1-like esterase
LAGALLAGCGDGDDDGPEKRLIAALGDSITAGAPGWDPDPVLREQLNSHDPTSQWEYWAQRELGDGFEFRNCGVPADRTDEIAARLDDCLSGADVAILQGGINDLVQSRTPRAAARNMSEMVSRAKAAGLPVFVANVLPVNGEDPRLTTVRPKIRRLNVLYEALAEAQGAQLIDFFETLEDPPGSQLMRPQWTAEGLHPSVEGYKLLGGEVAAACETNSSCSPR